LVKSSLDYTGNINWLYNFPFFHSEYSTDWTFNIQSVPKFIKNMIQYFYD
jgi:hypothetical protein